MGVARDSTAKRGTGQRWHGLAAVFCCAADGVRCPRFLLGACRRPDDDFRDGHDVDLTGAAEGIHFDNRHDGP